VLKYQHQSFVTTQANDHEKQQENTENQSKLEVITCSLHEAWQNVLRCIPMGSGFTFDQIKKWCTIFKPILLHS